MNNTLIDELFVLLGRRLSLPEIATENNQRRWWFVTRRRCVSLHGTTAPYQNTNNETILSCWMWLITARDKIRKKCFLECCGRERRAFNWFSVGLKKLICLPNIYELIAAEDWHHCLLYQLFEVMSQCHKKLGWAKTYFGLNFRNQQLFFYCYYSWIVTLTSKKVFLCLRQLFNRPSGSWEVERRILMHTRHQFRLTPSSRTYNEP